MSKIINKVLVILLLSIIFISNAKNIVQAITENMEAKIEEVGEAQYHLKYFKEEEGIDTYSICKSVGYYYNSIFYPAYCLNRKLSGVGKVDSYTVDVVSKYQDDRVWRVAKYGYPNVTAEEMGLCPDDAFAVTKFAIYCVIGEADVDLYSADEDDEIGQKMLQKLKELVNIGLNGNEKYASDISVEKVGNLVEEGEYYTQTFKVSSSVDMNYYSIIQTTGLEAGDIITNQAGQQREGFSANENFKVKILKSNLKSDKNIDIKINVQLNSYPIYYGQTRIPETQNYLLTSLKTEEFEVNAKLNIKTNTGKIEVSKIDDETNLGIKDTVFELYNSKNELIGTKTTDNEGKINFSELYPGTYKLKEIKANDNYIIDKNNEYIVEVNYDKTSSIVIRNQHKKGNISIYKVDKENKNIGLGNIEFQLYSEETGKMLGTYYTDENGKIEIKNLRTGNYVLKETRTNKWYNLAEDKEIKVQWNETTNVTVENELKKSRIQVIKVDKDNHEIKIPNVEFEILDSNNNVLEKIITDENGIAITKEYALRDYSKLKIHEVKTNDNYNLNEQIIEVPLEENRTKTITLENEKKKGQLKVIKVDKDNNEIKLKNVKFNILDEKQNVVDTIITDEKGEAITKMLPIDQKYTLQEISTNENYVLDSESKIITLQENQIKEMILENEKKKGQIRVIKVDKDNNEIKLANVEFNILDEKNNVVDTIVTNEEGVAITKKLPIDQKYTIQEIKTDEKYILSEETKTISLHENEITDTIFENEKIKGKIQVIKKTSEKSNITGLEKGKPLQGVTFEIINSKGIVVDKITTDSRGIAKTKDLEKGIYTLREVSTNEWYILDETIYKVEISLNNETVTLNIENLPANPDDKIEKQGPDNAEAGEEIEYKISVENTGNVPLENFVWEDEIPTEYIKATKINLGTYNQEKTYNLYYKTNFNDEYVLLLENLSTIQNEEIDLSKELSDNEYITNIKLDFGVVDVGFKTEIPMSIFAQVNKNTSSGSIFTNKATLKSNYKSYELERESTCNVQIYKILPTTGI